MPKEIVLIDQEDFAALEEDSIAEVFSVCGDFVYEGTIVDIGPEEALMTDVTRLCLGPDGTFDEIGDVYLRPLNTDSL